MGAVSYSYIRIIAQDKNGFEISDASIMEGDQCLGTTGGNRPLPLDPRVYRIYVEYGDLKSDTRKLNLEANSENDAPREVFVLKEPISKIV